MSLINVVSKYSISYSVPLWQIQKAAETLYHLELLPRNELKFSKFPITIGLTPITHKEEKELGRLKSFKRFPGCSSVSCYNCQKERLAALTAIVKDLQRRGYISSNIKKIDIVK